MIESLFGGSNDIINILGGVGFFVVVGITAWVLYVYVGAIKNTKSEGELAEENWDGIGEYKNPLPTGWAVIFAGLIVWTVWYWLAGYPTNAYSQIGEWNQENKEYKAEFESKWANPTEDELRGMGESLFLAKCAPCHGNTADGMGGKAANLADYGQKAHIEYVVKNGSKGLGYPGGEMPAGLASGADVSAVAGYVAGGLQGGGKGAEVFKTACASCHGEDGKGMFGTFPDLTAYGTTDFAIKAIKHGKRGDIGWMPAFDKEGTLTDVQYKAVATYILSIGK
jgi:cytochrome c oxidase cbb3-type subunit 3